jgi:hypothetical protein
VKRGRPPGRSAAGGKPISNTLDTGAPSSSVQRLPATTTSPTFTVSWSGQDDPGGSGIATFDVFVSDNGGPFGPFLQGTTATSAPFTGQVGQGEAVEELPPAEEDAPPGRGLNQGRHLPGGVRGVGGAVGVAAGGGQPGAEAGDLVGAGALVADAAALRQRGGVPGAVAGRHGLTDSLQEGVARRGHFTGSGSPRMR